MTRRIYLIQDLPPETVAVTFAKTSRSPEPFDEIAAGLTDEKSSKFHEKWVVGYGHSSVAEHAILHIALEDISIVAAKAIEDNRLSAHVTMCAIPIRAVPWEALSHIACAVKQATRQTARPLPASTRNLPVTDDLPVSTVKEDAYRSVFGGELSEEWAKIGLG